MHIHLQICSNHINHFPNSYIQFHSLAYIVKLYIELIMAELITKVVRANHIPNYSNSTELQENVDNSKPRHDESFWNAEKTNYIAHISALDTKRAHNFSVEILRDGTMAPDFGIQKTTSTVVKSKVEVDSAISSIREFESKD
jgi:hypothetical protein